MGKKEKESAPYLADPVEVERFDVASISASCAQAFTASYPHGSMLLDSFMGFRFLVFVTRERDSDEESNGDGSGPRAAPCIASWIARKHDMRQGTHSFDSY